MFYLKIYIYYYIYKINKNKLKYISNDIILKLFINNNIYNLKIRIIYKINIFYRNYNKENTICILVMIKFINHLQY